MFLSVGATAGLVMLGAFSRRSNNDPLMRRLLFLGGVLLGTIATSLLGFGSRVLLYRLNGVDWPI
jgi:hypothetical protein